MTRTPVALLAMDPDLPDRLFDDAARRLLRSAYDVDFTAVVRRFDAVDPERAHAAQVVVTGWGSPRIDAAVLAFMPNLRAVLHAAGSVRGHVDPVCWQRGLFVTTAADANAQPVAEYTLAMIILSAKDVFRAQAMYRTQPNVDPRAELTTVGGNGRRVGLVGASRIGRRVLDCSRLSTLTCGSPTPSSTPQRQHGLEHA